MTTGNDGAKEGEDDEEKGNKRANENNRKREKKAIKKKVKLDLEGLSVDSFVTSDGLDPWGGTVEAYSRHRSTQPHY